MRAGKNTNPPDELLGTWKTLAPKYADTAIALTRTTITFEAGQAGSHGGSIEAVEKVRQDGNILYTIFYVDPAGQEHSFVFYYDPADGGVMRWKNQRSIAWTRRTP